MIDEQKKSMTTIGVTHDVKKLLEETREKIEKEKDKRISFNETVEELCRILIPKV